MCCLRQGNLSWEPHLTWDFSAPFLIHLVAVPGTYGFKWGCGGEWPGLGGALSLLPSLPCWALFLNNRVWEEKAWVLREGDQGPHLVGLVGEWVLREGAGWVGGSTLGSVVAGGV